MHRANSCCHVRDERSTGKTVNEICVHDIRVHIENCRHVRIAPTGISARENAGWRKTHTDFQREFRMKIVAVPESCRKVIIKNRFNVIE